MRIISVTSAITALLLLTPAALAQVRYDTDLRQGFAFKPASKLKSGYVVALQVGDTQLTADLAGVDPTTMRGVPAVGVVDLFDWTGAYDQPISVTFNVSAANKAKIQALVRDPLLITKDVKFAVLVWDYETARNRYFNAVRPSVVTLLARFVMSGGRVLFTVAAQPGGAVPSPVNYAATMTLTPGPVEQYLFVTGQDTITDRMNWQHAGP